LIKGFSVSNSLRTNIQTYKQAQIRNSVQTKIQFLLQFVRLYLLQPFFTENQTISSTNRLYVHYPSKNEKHNSFSGVQA